MKHSAVQIATRLKEVSKCEFSDWFFGSKATQIDGVKPLVLYHGTCDHVSGFRPFSHFSTIDTAHAGINRSRRRSGLELLYGTDWNEYHPRIGDRDSRRRNFGYSAGHIYPVYLRITNPVKLYDTSENHSARVLSEICMETGVISRRMAWKVAQLSTKSDNQSEIRARRLLRNALFKVGIDGIRYTLKFEAPNAEAWIILSPLQVRFALSQNDEG